MKKVFYVMIVVLISGMIFAGCVSNVTEDAKSETVSESVSVEDELGSVSTSQSEIQSGNENQSEEENSEEVVEDYSVESIMARTEDLIAQYPDDDPNQIRALVLGMNLEYMERADVETVMESYGYAYEDFAIYFTGALLMKHDLAIDRSSYLRGTSEDYLLDRYEWHVLLDECCLNPDDVIEYKEFEDMMAFGELRDWSSCSQSYAETYSKEDKKAYIVIMIAMDSDSRNAIIEDFDPWDNFIYLYSQQ